MTVAALRTELKLTLAEMGELIALSKSQMHEVESSNRASLRVALAIEELSAKDGTPRIDAADLNDDVRASRQGVTGGGGAVHVVGITPATPAPATGQIGDLSGQGLTGEAA